MRTFVSFNNSGGLGNQMALLLHQLAFCKETGSTLAIKNLEKNRDDFTIRGTTLKYLHKDRLSGVQFGLQSIAKRSLDLLARNRNKSFSSTILLNKSVSQASQLYQKLVHQENYTLLTTSWNVRFHELVAKHAAQLRKDVRFSDKVQQLAEEFFTRQELDEDTLKIGIHIRRGDYEQFEGGRYLYPLDYYEQVMIEVAHLFPERDIHFVIFSNESTKLDNKNNYRITYSDQPAIVDMCIMSGLDLLLGPPSTFSGTASFLGNVPFLELKVKDQPVTYSSFRVYEI